MANEFLSPMVECPQGPNAKCTPMLPGYRPCKWKQFLHRFKETKALTSFRHFKSMFCPRNINLYSHALLRSKDIFVVLTSP